MVDIQVLGGAVERSEEILTPEALEFLAGLHERFAGRRDELLAARAARREEASRTGRLDFLAETREVRESDWRVAGAPEDLVDRRVEITGPTERKMAINALNSGARVWLADLEDANTPHWHNVVGGQVNLADAVRGTIAFTSPEGKEYALKPGRHAVIVMRPRGWHLDERHITVGGRRAVGALVDFGLYFFHNAKALLERGSGPYFYLPKMESHLEARLWNDVFTHAQEALGIPHGTVRATVLIETIPAAFEMEEILHELRDHASGLNAGRWDYLFSIIKYFRDAGADFVLPDRNDVTMTAPFMRAYTELLVRTCHKRGAFAMGGMAAFIPNRRDPEVTESALAKVHDDKRREAGDGFDGSWVAHPDLVAICDEEFTAVLGAEPNQLGRLRADVSVTAAQLLDIRSTPGNATAAGLRGAVDVGVRYLASWLGGNGAAAIHNLMEDAATAEISRSQVWQWVRNEVKLDTGATVTADLVRGLLSDVREALTGVVPAEHLGPAVELFEQVALADDFPDFLTLPAYERI
ncbi:malate synthase A [Actinophytocola glycyrrhizae]|uniref:Malate synthase n=1 Tax=Actinophytocola glycyrrhizae TaxID=2044873 RepID=A0ABV9S424_9PSEU